VLSQNEREVLRSVKYGLLASLCSPTSDGFLELGGHFTWENIGGQGKWIAEIWQLYEDVCLVCAGAWMGTLWNRNGGYDAGLDSADGNDFDLSNDGDPSSGNNNSNIDPNPNSSSNSEPTTRGFSLKHSFSTPNPGARGGGTSRRGARYNSIAIPSVRSSSGFSRKKGGGSTTMAGRHPRSVSSGAAPTGDEHDSMVVVKGMGRGMGIWVWRMR
jgi:hypothetical protein